MFPPPPTDPAAPTPNRSRWLGVAILAIAAIALVLEFWMIPSLRFWDTQNEAFQQGLAAYREGEYEKAIPLFTGVIEKRPRFAPAHIYRGTCYRLTNKMDLALADFDRFIQLDPAAPHGYYNRAITYLARRDFNGAIKDLNETLRRDPNYAPALANRGFAFRSLGEKSTAFADFDEAIRLAPKEGSFYSMRGTAYSQNGEYAKAIEDFSSNINIEPARSTGYNNLAWLLGTCPQAEVRDGQKAIEMATKACELTQWKDSRPIDTLAAAYAEAGDFEQAVKWQVKCLDLKLPPENVLADYQARLALYRARTPFRQPANQ